MDLHNNRIGRLYAIRTLSPDYVSSGIQNFYKTSKEINKAKKDYGLTELELLLAKQLEKAANDAVFVTESRWGITAPGHFHDKLVFLVK